MQPEPTSAPRPSGVSALTEAIARAVAKAPVSQNLTAIGRQFGITHRAVGYHLDRWERLTGEHIPRSHERKRLQRQPPENRSLAQRLLENARLDRKTGCWLWTGTSEQPFFRELGESSAYRVAYVLWIGPLKPDEWVVRTCGKRRCINPYHLVALEPGRDRGSWPRRRPQPRAPATHCMKGHEFTPDTTVSNPGYVVVDGVRKKVTYRTCRICRDLRVAGKAKPKQASLTPVNTIKDEHERFLEQIIRRVTRAPVAERLSEIRRGVLVDSDLEWPDTIRLPALSSAEDYWKYLDRTGTAGSFEDWILSRIFRDPRIQKVLARTDRLVADPLLQAEVNRARLRAAADRTPAGRAGGGGDTVMPFPEPPLHGGIRKGHP